jgi:hypothetical protein
MAEEVHFLLFVGGKLLFSSQAVQYPKGSDTFLLQVAVALIRLMRSLGGLLC